MTQYIKRLPQIFQTTTEKQFFDATFDQVFTKKDSSYLAGYLGRRDPGYFDPINDFYIPEPDKDRTWWQLEATAYALNVDSTKSNVFFYEDLMNRINYYGGNTLNQDRLTESEYYSFGPPIDYDMFINYQNYYWVESGLQTISITGLPHAPILGSDIIGQASYTTPATATPPNLTLSTGMTIQLLDDPVNYPNPVVVENIGGCVGIRLVPIFSDISLGATFEFLPWDGSITLPNGRVINNSNWDENTWDVEIQPGFGDYITIERGAITQNAWSRSNKWFHINVINKVASVTATAFPANATNALRPIIQFVADLELFESGTQFKAEIDYGFRDNAAGQPLRMIQDFQGQPVHTLNSTYNVNLTTGDLVAFFNDTTSYQDEWGLNPWDEPAPPDPWDPSNLQLVNTYIWEVTVNVSGNAIFTPYTSFLTPVVQGDIVFVDNTGPYDAALSGSTWYYSDGVWQEAFNDKISANQPPLFQLYDYNGVQLQDPTTYPLSSFEGSKIFSYAIDTTPGAVPDVFLGFPILYTALAQSSDILFNNDLITDRYTYGSYQPINGYYYYMMTGDPVLYNNWNLYDICSCSDIVPTPPVNCVELSKQRVIDQYVVGYGTQYQFQLSVVPYGYVNTSSLATADILVYVNQTLVNAYNATTNPNGYTFNSINNIIYVNLTNYLTALFLTPQSVAPVVQIRTYPIYQGSNPTVNAEGLLNPTATGYFQIPQQLEANPSQLEVGQVSGSDLIQQFSSIIANQINFSGTAYGGPTNYRDSRKNRSLGSYILQNIAPLLKTMLVSEGDALDFINAIRFSQNNYTRFKNKYTTVAQQLINQQFDPVQYQSNSIVISAWVDEILKIINISKEFSNAFAYSYMVASGTPTYSETHIVPANSLVTLTNYVDLTNPANVMYVYDATNPALPLMLLVDQDYTVASTNLIIDVQMKGETNVVHPITTISGNGSVITLTYTGTGVPVGSYVTIAGVTGTPALNGTFQVATSSTTLGVTTLTISSTIIGAGIVAGATVRFLKTLVFYLYQNPLPTYIPSTPTKLGLYPTYLPRIEIDFSYATPTNVLIGHDGSKTVLFGDYRDSLLLELERRIYNGIQPKFIGEYYVPLRVESVQTGYFRSTRYTREEYLNITQPYFNKWCAKNRASYAANNWAVASQTTPINELWKLYNYADAITPTGVALNLPGNWKGIYQFYYDTIYPDIAPWEMLGFSQQPEWWVSQYGPGIINGNGQTAWPSTNTAMWSDIENGIIRQGPTAIFDPYTLMPVSQALWARPGLITPTAINPGGLVPVDASGNTIPITTLFTIQTSGNPYEPYDGFDNDWVYGDGAPVEQAWLSTSQYAFNTQEFLYLMRPGPFGELAWETLGTEVAPGQLLNIPGIEVPVLSNTNWQYVQNEVYPNLSSDPFFYWMRPKNADQYVHAETVDGVVQIRFGYQCWISDNILFSGADITSTFGQYIRTLDVNLANKFAGFTNETTINTYIQAVTPGTTTNTLVIPSTNLDVILQKGPPVATYTYSGVIIRALANGTFVVYGYDLLNAAFTTLDRTNDQLINVSVGGTSAPYQNFVQNVTYGLGVIVKYNGIYYLSLTNQTVDIFSSGQWQQLASLPTVGGISVIYKPISATTTTIVPYGTILNTPQEVFDFMIGWGAYLSSQGWQFDNVDPTTNLVSDWLYSAKQFLFWLNTNWAPNASIQLSPLANKATLIVSEGYPDDVETMSNDVYSILDKYGTAIIPTNTVVERDGQTITVSPLDLAAGGIYFLLVNSSETEHILIFDNTTSFNDIIYDPLLRARQERIRFNGFRNNGWYGKMEAAGYLIINNQLVPNYDTIVDSIRQFYNPNYILDNQSLEQLGRHLIGFNEQAYLDNMEVTGNIQYMFYQGAIRQKGTEQAISSLFRSTEVQPSGESITIFEEWALKLGSFGSTIEQVTTEFILQPDQNAGQVVVARMNFVPSTIGSVQEILIMNAEDVYSSVPKIVIDAPDADPSDPALTGPLVQATAYAILNSNNVISRVDIINPGYGYTKAPVVSIIGNVVSTGSDGVPDLLYSVWQGQYVTDSVPNNIIDISISQSNIWTVRPIDPSVSLEFPTTPQIDYIIPNAGYVNFNDVDYSVFDKTQTVATWGKSTSFNPIANNTVWVANTFVGDWDVYKLNDVTSSIDFQIQENQDGTLSIFIPAGKCLIPQFGSPDGQNPLPSGPYTNYSTDFGNLIVLQVIEATATATVSSGHVASIVLNQQGANYYTIPTVTISPPTVGIQATATATIAGGVVTGFVITNPGTGYTILPTVTISPPTSVAGTTNNIFAFTFDQAQSNADPTHNYYDLVDLNGDPVSASNFSDYANYTNLLVFGTMRIQPGLPLVAPSYAATNDKIWVDQFIPLLPAPQVPIWGVFTNTPGTAGLPMNPVPNFTLFRQQGLLIDTSLFQSASIFDNNNNELVQLPIYDPFKEILPGPARQNITYITEHDPATYNVTQDPTLFNENITFDSNQVGQLWWDLSAVKYVYYEQPITLDGSETETDNLIYRRDHWGEIFPGSTVNVYEWVQSTVPPSQYTGSGTPRSVNTYVQVTVVEPFTDIIVTYYYFWVLGATDQPNVENRTLPAIDVSLLLQSPLSQNFSFFCPIQQTTTNNSYMFFNVLSILAYQGNNVQVKYRVAERDDQKHAQWSFFREGDANSLVTDQFWNKMVDSLCAWTTLLPVTPEYQDGILLANYLPWDTYGWDISQWDDATSTTTPVYGLVLPVPDPTLSPIEQLGIQYRPRQGMFYNLSLARQVFVESANNLLQYIPIRDNNPSWGATLPGWNSVTQTDNFYDVYWTYTNYYATGFVGVTPTIIYPNQTVATAALQSLQIGTIVQINNATADGLRYILYQVVQLNPSVPTLSYNEVAIQNSAIELLPSIYTTSNVYSLSVELRGLLYTFRTQVFIDEYLVDQNEVFFSMLNFVISEKKNPDWVFKSSNIFIEENNLQLSQPLFYVPDQINNIIDYITGVKPYHTQIRSYSSQYAYTDMATGVASDSHKWNIKLQFGGDYSLGIEVPTPIDLVDAEAGFDLTQTNGEPFGVFAWDTSTIADVINQFISGLSTDGPPDDSIPIITVPLTTLDPTKVGLSQLFPYTFNFNSVNLNNPQTFITPSNVIGVLVGTTVLIAGQDFFVQYNNDGTYTAYFYNNPGTNPVPVALVWWDGGHILRINNYTPNAENVDGTPSNDDMVSNIDTQLPVNALFPSERIIPGNGYTPLVGSATYFNVPLIGGSGTGATAEITVTNGSVVSVTPTNEGTGYLIGDILSASSSNIGGTGSGFSVPLSATGAQGTWDYSNSNLDTILDNVNSGPPPGGGSWLGYDEGPWDQDTYTYIVLLPAVFPSSAAQYTISHKENKDLTDGDHYYRNAAISQGTLVYDLPAPVSSDDNIQSITITATSDILPEPTASFVPAIWIHGERIEYKQKQSAGVNTWELSLIRRGTMGTSAEDHPASSRVIVEQNNLLVSTASTDIWNTAGVAVPDPSTIQSPTYPLPTPGYTSVTNVPFGGLWYATTSEAIFLVQGPGMSIS